MHIMSSMVLARVGPMNEKLYKSLSRIGGGTLAVGVVVLVTGVAAGTILIINGAKLIKKKYEIMI